jgi:hypothetical protein
MLFFVVICLAVVQFVFLFPVRVFCVFKDCFVVGIVVVLVEDTVWAFLVCLGYV